MAANVERTDEPSPVLRIVTLCGVARLSATVRAPSRDRPWRRLGAFGYALARLRGIVRPAVIVTEAPGDIVIDRDAEVRARDGTVLRVNVFRGPGVGPLPAILSIHPYEKDKLPAGAASGGPTRFSIA